MFTPDEIEIFKRLFKKKKFSVYSLWSGSSLFKKIVDELAEPFKDKGITKVLGIESRGFILGAPVAYKLSTGFVPARKGGKLFKTGYSKEEFLEESFADYTKQNKSLEIELNEKSIGKGDKVLIIDDWFETGAQGHAAIRLVERTGATVAGIGIMFDDMKPEVKESFKGQNLHSLITLADYERSEWF